MKRIIKIKEGEKVPENATLLRVEKERGKLINTSYEREGFFPFHTDYKIYHYEQIPVFYYEVEENDE